VQGEIEQATAEGRIALVAMAQHPCIAIGFKNRLAKNDAPVLEINGQGRFIMHSVKQIEEEEVWKAGFLS
jgi:hypothetical protein